MVPRLAHNQKVAGSTPASATILNKENNMDIYDFLYVISTIADIGFKIGILCLIKRYLEIRSVKQ